MTKEVDKCGIGDLGRGKMWYHFSQKHKVCIDICSLYALSYLTLKYQIIDQGIHPPHWRKWRKRIAWSDFTGKRTTDVLIFNDDDNYDIHLLALFTGFEVIKNI